MDVFALQKKIINKVVQEILSFLIQQGIGLSIEDWNSERWDMMSVDHQVELLGQYFTLERLLFWLVFGDTSL